MPSLNPFQRDSKPIALEMLSKEEMKKAVEAFCHSLNLDLNTLSTDAPTLLGKRLLKDVPEELWNQVLTQEKARHHAFIQTWIEPVRTKMALMDPSRILNSEFQGFFKRLANYNQQIELFEWHVVDHVLLHAKCNRMEQIQHWAALGNKIKSNLARFSLLNVQTPDELSFLLQTLNLDLRDNLWLFHYKPTDGQSVFKDSAFFQRLVGHFQSELSQIPSASLFGLAKDAEQLRVLLQVSSTPLQAKSKTIKNVPFLNLWYHFGLDTEEVGCMTKLLADRHQMVFPQWTTVEWVRHLTNFSVSSHDAFVMVGAKKMMPPSFHYPTTTWMGQVERIDVALESYLKDKHGFSVQSYPSRDYSPRFWGAVLGAHPKKDTLDEGGWGLLHHLVASGHFKPVKLLIEAGWNGALQTSSGVTPLQILEISQYMSSNKLSPAMLKSADLQMMTVLLEKSSLEEILKSPSLTSGSSSPKSRL